ncbi:hypothetical protein JTB14_023163 [Gonioctena quinquepunctata]|nr:hypothetical protein JTB14_023163 [Gonioctena quinquepunctata]
MFSSPAVRPYISENADNLVQRKPGANQISRKPFVDRSVNSKTPDINKITKSKLHLSKETTAPEKLSPKAAISCEIPKITISPRSEDLNTEDYVFSGKQVEAHSDNFWPELHLDREDILNILQKYCQNADTPPPSPSSDIYETNSIDIDPMFLELPTEDVQNQVRPYFLEDSFEVEVPQMESDDDFDTSLD